MTVIAIWNSLDVLNSIKEWIAAILVVLAVIGFFVDRRSTKLQKEEDRQSDHKLAQAGRDAAEANQRAAEGQERAAQTQKEAALLALKVEELRKENLELATKLQPRRVDPQARQRAIEILNRMPELKVQLHWSARDQETIDFAAEVKEVLLESGCYVLQLAGQPSPFESGVRGECVSFPTPGRFSAAARDAIERALRLVIPRISLCDGHAEIFPHLAFRDRRGRQLNPTEVSKEEVINIWIYGKP